MPRPTLHLQRYTYPLLVVMVLVVLAIPEVAFAETTLSGIFAKAGFEILNSTIYPILWAFVVMFFGMLVSLAGTFLNVSINFFVLGFGWTYLNTGIGYAVDSTWVIVRDFVNLAFIFGLVYIGLKMILDIDSSNTRRALARLIIAALFVNFSLFITKAVVDFSNQIAAEIMVGSKMAEKSSSGEYESNISGELRDRMGLTSALKLTRTQDQKSAGFGYIMGVAMLFSVAAFVLFAMAILLMTRFAILIIYLLVSPLMFVGWILSPFGDTMNRYWHDFLKRCFFAPIFFLFLYFTFQIIGGLQTAISTSGTGGTTTNLANPDWGKTFNPSDNVAASDSVVGTLPFFILICIFLFFSLTAADRLSGDSAGFARKMAGKATFGLTGRVGRETIGRSADRFAQSKWLTEQAGKEGLAGWAARRTMRGAEYTSGASFDVRGIGAANSHLKAGEAHKGGFKAQEEARDKDAAERNRLATKARNTQAIDEGIPAHQARQEEEERRIAAGAAEGTVEVTRGGVTSFVDRSTLTADEEAARKKQDDSIAAMQRVAADMKLKEFEDMSEAEQLAIAEFVSGELTDGVKKSDKISEEQKGKISKKQKETIEKIIKRDGVVPTDKLADLSIRQIETLGDEFVSQNAHLFTDGQFAEIKKSKKFTEGQVGRYIGTRKANLLNRLDPAHPDYDPESVFEHSTGAALDPATNKHKPVYTNKKRKVADIAKLPGEVLAHDNSVKFLTVDVLKAIANNDKDFERVSTTQREKIERMVIAEDQRYLGANTQFNKAANYLRSPKGQEDFIGVNP